MYRRVKKVFLLALTFTFFLPILKAQASQSTETQIFYPNPGDTAVIHNDFGRIRIKKGSNSTVEAKIRKIAVDAEKLLNIDVVSQKSQGKIFIQVYYYDYDSETVFIDLQVPDYLNVVIWGANPAIELSGLKGYVRANSLTGFISAEDLHSSASLATEDGNIIYRSTIQPSGDIRLESLRGNITCRINDGLNLRGWLRAGKTLSWNNELEMSQGSLEKQVGIGGPMLMASSTNGNVTFTIDSSIKSQSSVAPLQSTGSKVPNRTTQPDHSSSKSSASQTFRTGSNRPELISAEKTTEEIGSNGNSEPPSTPAAIAYPADINPSGTGGYSLKVNVDWVYVNASVRDRYTNRAVADLQMQDFRIYENGDLQKIDRFTPIEAPFNLLLLLDVSGSTKSYMDLVKDASVQFTQQIGVDDQIALATFNSRTRLRLDFTNDRRQVEKAIRKVKSGGGTAFYDALDRCVRRYMRDIEGRKAIVVFTDGVDNQLTGDFGNGSEITFRELFREIQEEDVLIYTIFLDTEDEHGRSSSRFPRSGNPGNLGDILADIILGRGGGSSGGSPPWGRGDPAYARARQELEMIADQTGGRMYAPRDIRDLSNVYGEIADDLRIQYTLGYHSSHPRHDGEWREIQVEIVNHPNLAVRARKGYYIDLDQP